VTALLRRGAGLLLALVLVLPAAAPAADVPFLSGRVVDNAEILKPATRERITAALKAHEASTANQIVVLTITTIGSDSVEEFSTRVFESWKLGQKGRDNGVLVVVVLEGRLRRGFRHRQEREGDALVRPLLGESARKLESCDHLLLDEDLPEWLPAPLLLGQGLCHLFLRREAELDEDVTDSSSDSDLGHGSSAHGERHRFHAGQQERSGRSDAAAEPTRVVSAAVRCRWLTRLRE